MIGGFQAGWPVVLKHFGELIPEAALPVGERMPTLVAPLLERLCAEPTCLSHADVRLDNIFFGEDEIVLVDWQSVCVSAPEQDLAYFVTPEHSTPSARPRGLAGPLSRIAHCKGDRLSH